VCEVECGEGGCVEGGCGDGLARELRIAMLDTVYLQSINGEGAVAVL
jgi:hypothetical protein